MAYWVFLEVYHPDFSAGSTTLIGGYVHLGKCGKLLVLIKFLIFEIRRTWFLGIHGLGREESEIYSLMQRNKIKPNGVIFVGESSACGHMGLAEEGLHHFNSVIRDHFIAPRMDHMAAMVNLFALSGQTRRAYEFIKSFPIDPDKVLW